MDIMVDLVKLVVVLISAAMEAIMVIFTVATMVIFMEAFMVDTTMEAIMGDTILEAIMVIFMEAIIMVAALVVEVLIPNFMGKYAHLSYYQISHIIIINFKIRLQIKLYNFRCRHQGKIVEFWHKIHLKGCRVCLCLPYPKAVFYCKKNSRCHGNGDDGDTELTGTVDDNSSNTSGIFFLLYIVITHSLSLSLSLSSFYLLFSSLLPYKKPYFLHSNHFDLRSDMPTSRT